MKSKKVLWLCAGLGILLGAGNGFGQNIFSGAKADLSFNASDEVIYLAQGGTAEPEKAKEPAEPAKKKARNPNLGGFGGPFAGYLWIDLSPLDKLTEDRDIDDFDDYLVTVGGLGGVIYKDFRMGGFGFGGIKNFVEDEVNGEDLSAEITIGGGGLLLEYNHALNNNFGILAGAMLGAIGVNLAAHGADLGGDEGWSETKGTYLAEPYAGVWFAPVKYFWIQLTGGYLYFNLDEDEFEYHDVDVLDGDLQGGWQASINFLFGSNPNIK